jgi:hypothetical protein
MNDKSKQRPPWVFIAAMFCFGLVSAALTKHWWLFWGIIGAHAFAVLVGTLGSVLTSRTRRTILKNLTPDEKAALSSIGQQTGKRLGMRVAPIAFMVPCIGMLFGFKSLIYTLPPAIILLVILCVPVWRTVRKQTSDKLLSTVFARANGIETLLRDSQPNIRQVSSESAQSADPAEPST